MEESLSKSYSHLNGKLRTPISLELLEGVWIYYLLKENQLILPTVAMHSWGRDTSSFEGNCTITLFSIFLMIVAHEPAACT